METPVIQLPLGGFARILVLDNLLDEETAISELENAKAAKNSYVHHLVSKKIVDASVLAFTASMNFGLPLIDLSSFNAEFIPHDQINEELINRHTSLPLYRKGDHLFIATADPTNQIALDEFKFYTGLHTHGVLVEADKLTQLIEKVLNAQESAVLKEFENSDFDGIDIAEADELESSAVAVEADEAPIVRFVHKALLDAIHKGASDIHFESYEKTCRVRMRLDGILYEMASPPVTLASRIVARLKVMSKLDISERRVPQDGRFKIKLTNNRAIDFRVSTCPTVAGEKVVIRILDPASAKIGIDALGFEPDQRKLFLDTLNQPQGMILVTGPTGSGKTVTLYTALNILNTPEKNISTVEDPVEIHVAGINQVIINPKAGLTFPRVLRSFLRQDPDIIMVGEMRDLETAEIGIKAAQTGHLVLSTLHTNNAPETLTRLANMGIPAYNIATSVNLIIAQRLARKLCEHCREEKALPEHVLLQEGFAADDIADITVYSPKGCEHCTNGYKGRIGIFEILPVTERIKELILSDGHAPQIAKLATEEGMINLRKSGLLKVKQGITSLEEINRVTKD